MRLSSTSTARTPPPLTAYACLAVSMTLVGAYVALSRPLVMTIPVFLLAFLRFGIAALAMPHWLRKPAGEPSLSRSVHGWLFLQSLLGNFLFSVCMLYGMRLSSAVTAGIAMAALPAAIAMLSRLALGEHLPGRTILAIVLAVTGMGLTQWPAADALGGTTPTSPWGGLLLLAAVSCEAAYVVIGKKLSGHLGARRISAIINLWGLALTAPLGILQGWFFDFGDMTAGLWGLLLFYALAASVWSVWLWMTGLRTVPASQSGLFTVFLPLAATLTGVLALGEEVDGARLLALGLAIAGILLATAPASRILQPGKQPS